MFRKRAIAFFVNFHDFRSALLLEFHIPDGVSDDVVFNDFDKTFSEIRDSRAWDEQNQSTVMDIFVLTKQAIEKQYGCICIFHHEDCYEVFNPPDEPLPNLP